MSDSCIFCAISTGRAPARFIYQDDSACSFLDINPLRAGHTLVVPRRHVHDLTDGHFHLVPRHPGDGQLTDHTPDEGARLALDETHRTLRGGAA